MPKSENYPEWVGISPLVAVRIWSRLATLDAKAGGGFDIP